VFDFLIADNIVGFETLTIASTGLPRGLDFGVSRGPGGLQIVTSAAAAVPEPSSLALIVIGGLG